MKIKISEIKHIASLIVAIEYGQLWRVDMEGGEATLITDLESDHKDFFVMLTGSSWAVVSEEDTLGPCNLSGAFYTYSEAAEHAAWMEKR